MFYFLYIITAVFFLPFSLGSYLGCYKDETTSRDLPEPHSLPFLTVNSCILKCGSVGFSYAGLQYSSECYCGNSYGKYGRLNESDCNYKCLGNSSQMCGGASTNSIYATRTTAAAAIRIGYVTTTTTIAPNTPQWSLFYSSNVLTSSTKHQLVRLFEIVTTTVVTQQQPPVNVYANCDYYQSQSQQQQSKLVVSTLVNQTYGTRTVYLTQPPSTSLILWWLSPTLSVYVDCELLVRLDFTSSSADLFALSLPYSQPQSVRITVGSELQSLADSFIQGACTSTSTIASTTSTNIISLDTNFSEWGIYLSEAVFQQQQQVQEPIRIFDLVDAKLYINSNYYPSNMSVDINIYTGTYFARRLLSINPSLIASGISSMMLTWNTPNLYVFVNCKLAGQLSFGAASDLDLASAMSTPYFRKSALQMQDGGVFDETVRETFIRSGCVGPDFVFPGATSLSTMSTTSLITATTSLTTPQAPTLMLTSFWFTPSSPSNTTASQFLINSGEFVRLFEIAQAAAKIYANADYYPTRGTIEVSTLVGNIYSRRYFNISTTSSSSSEPIITLILAWKYPTLSLTVNCDMARTQRLDYTSTDLTALSLPYFDRAAIASPGYSVETSIEQTYREAGCSGTLLVTSTPVITSTPATVTTTTSSTATIMESILTATADSIATIPDDSDKSMMNIKSLVDSNFILAIYNTRILQYQNLLKLQQIFQDYNRINLDVYNLTFINCI